jgi:hypothetical protein
MLVNIDGSFADDEGVTGVYLKFAWEGEDYTLAICEEECCVNPGGDDCGVEESTYISNVLYPGADANSFSFQFNANGLRGKTIHMTMWLVDGIDSVQRVGELQSQVISP